MRLALIADLHGNFTATQALEMALRRLTFDKLICLGDLVGKGPSSDLCFDWAFANCDHIIGGNWDYGLGNKKFPKDGFYWEQLGEHRLRKLKNLPQEWHFSQGKNRLRCIHGRPIMDELLGSKTDNKDFEALLHDGTQSYNLLAYADIHRQLLRTVKAAHIINCGSVGNPLGVGNVSFALLEFFEDDAYSISYHSQPYDIQSALDEAINKPDQPHQSEYLKEIETAVYHKRFKELL